MKRLKAFTANSLLLYQTNETKTLLTDPDRRRLEWGDVLWHWVPGWSERQGDDLLHLLYCPDTLWQLYPAFMLTCACTQMCCIHVQYLYVLRKVIQMHIFCHIHKIQLVLLLLSFAYLQHVVSFLSPLGFHEKHSASCQHFSLTSATTDTLLNVFLAIAVDNLANAQELTKVQVYVLCYVLPSCCV